MLVPLYRCMAAWRPGYRSGGDRTAPRWASTTVVRGMRVCLMVEGQEGVTWGQWLDLARACEGAGLDALFRSDHYLSVRDDPSRGSLDAWATLATLASATERIRLGTLVSPATFRHPSVLAKMVTTADHISGGRVELGRGGVARARAHRLRLPVPGRRHEAGAARGADRDRPPVMG